MPAVASNSIIRPHEMAPIDVVTAGRFTPIQFSATRLSDISTASPPSSPDVEVAGPYTIMCVATRNRLVGPTTRCCGLILIEVTNARQDITETEPLDVAAEDFLQRARPVPAPHGCPRE
jgi:hypothetical protein